MRAAAASPRTPSEGLSHLLCTPLKLQTVTGRLGEAQKVVMR